MKKRILSIVLAVLMLVGIMPISAIAVDTQHPAAQTGVSTKTSENTTGPKLEKSAQWVDEKAGIAKITIQVTGEEPTQSTKKTDIVLVIDRSLSMTEDDNERQRDWLKNAKKAAKAFAKKVLTGDPNVRIAVVAYAAKTINDWDFSSDLTTVENHIDDINTNNVYYKGQWYKNHYSLQSENWHGTNIQAGIHSARERFKITGNNDANKFMIVLADGEPNRRFGKYSASETWRLTSEQAADYHIKTDYKENGKQYFPNLYTADSTTFSYDNSDIMDANQGYCYTATVSEAYAAKATDGITCYAIGYGIASGSSLINALMYSIASTDAGFVNAGTDENAITKVFSDIATDIQYKAYDVKLTDTMGAGFTYYTDTEHQPSHAVTPSAGNKTVTWDVADKLGDERKTLTFYVQYDKQNLTEAATLPTNTSASLSYKDNKGNAQPNIKVASPEIENLAKKVTYIDENDNVYTGEAYQEKLHWYGDTVTLAPAPTKEGYTFNGWTTSDVAIGEGATSFEMPKRNVTLKASWTENDYLLSTGVHYSPNTITTPPDSVLDSASSSVRSQRLKKDAQVTLPDFDDVQDSVNDGVWKFHGWYEYYGMSDETKHEGTFTMPARDVSLDAVWTFQKNERFNVTYKYEPDAASSTYELPSNVTATKPTGENVLKGTTVKPDAITGSYEDAANDGVWTFVEWTPEEASEISVDQEFVGTWHFTKNEPKETTYTIEYYRQNADGEYPDYPDHRKPQPGDPALTGTVGSTAKVTDVDQNYVTHYDADGYKFDAENEKNVLQCTLQADASKNVLRLYYKALPKLEVKKEVDEQYNVKHGDTLTYTITVKNAGARNLTNVEVTDVIDAADPSKLEILSGEGYAYNEESGKIEIGRMEPGDEVVIKATYVVQEADSGNTIMNTAFGSANEVEVVTGTVKAYPNEIEEFNGDLVISKTYRSDTSTSPAATFYFDVYYMDGDEQISLLDEYAEISFDQNEAKKGAPATKTVEVKLNDVNEKVLESGFYVREVLEDKVDKVVYDRNAVHGFLVPFPLISDYANTDREPITVDRDAYVVSTQVYENAGAFWAELVTDKLDENYKVFSFTNTYKTVRTEPVKVGPQLNRDDHVAYIMGYPDGTVQPEGQITRAEACTIFFRLLTDSSRDYYFSKTNDYTDVNAGDWFNNAISTLSNAGIVTGYNDGTFRPNQPITRGEMAKIIANFANLKYGGKTFTDLAGHWSKSYVELAAGNGWIAGYPDGSFRPDQKITRAETVTMINRVLDRVPAKESRLLSRSIMLTFPDNKPGDWYYIAIQEASNSHEYQRSVYETTGDEMWTKLIDNVDWTKLEK